MTRLAVIILLIFTGVGAVFGGAALVIDPTGSSLKIPLDVLKHGPFEDFLIPGLILFVILGLGSLITSIVVITKAKGYPFLTIFMGFAISIWIAVQLLIIRDVHYVHLVFGLIGILMIIMGIMLRRKEYGLKL